MRFVRPLYFRFGWTVIGVCALSITLHADDPRQGGWFRNSPSVELQRLSWSRPRGRDRDRRAACTYSRPPSLPFSLIEFQGRSANGGNRTVYPDPAQPRVTVPRCLAVKGSSELRSSRGLESNDR